MLLKPKKDKRKSYFDNPDFDGTLHKRANLKMLSDIIEAHNASEKNKDAVSCPYDPFKELRADQFFIDEKVRDEDAESLSQKNQLLRKGTNLTSTSAEGVNPKLIATREYVIMIKETLDMYKSKKQYLEELKMKRTQIEDNMRDKYSEMSNKVTEKIFQHRALANDQVLGSNYETDATTEADKNSAVIIPTLNDEVERVQLITKRGRDEAKNKLLKAKELVISA